MLKTFMAVAVVLLAACSRDDVGLAPAITEFKGGFETDLVRITRMNSQMFGRNLKIEFPQNPYESDRAELGEIIEAHGGNIIEMGGEVGAPIYAVFNGMIDRATQNAKILELLLPLTDQVHKF